jgi:hypothetical protein
MSDLGLALGLEQICRMSSAPHPVARDRCAAAPSSLFLRRPGSRGVDFGVVGASGTVDRISVSTASVTSTEKVVTIPGSFPDGSTEIKQLIQGLHRQRERRELSAVSRRPAAT